MRPVTRVATGFPDKSVIVLRQACQVTGVSLFAFISELCPNRQVTREEQQIIQPVTGAAQGRAGSSGLDEAGGRDEAIAARVSLAVAAKASAENFPVALRVLPKRWRANLTALYGFARLVDDIGDEPLPGMPGDATPEQVTATRLALLDELEADVRKIYDNQEPDLQAIKDLGRTVRDTNLPVQPLYDLIQANRQDQ